MDELFRLKIVGKRQVTLPQRMMNVLRLSEGDELQVEVSRGLIIGFRSLKLVPTDLFTPEILTKLDERERELERREAEPIEISRLQAAAGTTAEPIVTKTD